jgi:hypothetical protein
MKPKTRKKCKKRTFTKKHFNSKEGMLTSVWGPGLWHYMHTMSFNYPLKPTKKDKKKYKAIIYNLRHTLPCKHCRVNLTNNLKINPIKDCHLKDRNNFSRYVYNLHNKINIQLGKSKYLNYCKVRERYEHFRAHCTTKKKKIFKIKKDKGCTEPLYGEKSKCILKIVPQKKQCKGFSIDKTCLKRRL